MTQFKTKPLSPHAVEMLGQLFVNGPTWDGDVVSKAGRGELLKAGMAFKVQGFTTLTEDGLRAAIEWDMSSARTGRWYCKQNNIPWPRTPRRPTTSGAPV